MSHTITFTMLNLLALLLPFPAGAAELPDAEVHPVIEQRISAYRTLQMGDYTEAATRYVALTVANPYDGALLYNLGFCLLKSGEYERARDAFDRAIRTGWYPENCLYNIACTYALEGSNRQALTALEDAYAHGYIGDHELKDDPDLAGLHDLPRFREIVGWPNPALQGRTQHWIADLDFLERRLAELHWHLYRKINKTELAAAFDTLRQSIESRTDLELRLDTQSLLVRIGDGHTAVTRDHFRVLHDPHAEDVALMPIELFLFDDGPRIIEATPDLTPLLGGRLQSIGGYALDSLMPLVMAQVSRDNEWGAKWGAAIALTDQYLLAGLGLGSLTEGFAMDVKLPDGRTVTEQIIPAGREALQRISLLESRAGTLPPTHKERDRLFHLESVDQTLYIRIDGIADTHGETFADFTDRIFQTAERAGAIKLVIDLRNNPGGQGHLATTLIDRLAESETFNRPNHLYVLIGRTTFSAAIYLAASLELRTSARFVGEPSGSSPNFVGESTIVRLPYSGLAVSISSRYHQNSHSDDRRQWITPDIAAPPQFEDWWNGKDSGWEALKPVL